MAEALRARGMAVTHLQRGAEILPTLDAELGALVRAELPAHGVQVETRITVNGSERSAAGLRVAGDTSGVALNRTADLVLVAAGVRPATGLLEAAGACVGRAVPWSSTGGCAQDCRTSGRRETL